MKLLYTILALSLLTQVALADYAPNLGRFTQRDPIGEPGMPASPSGSSYSSAFMGNQAANKESFAARDPVFEGGHNRYAFVRNRALDSWDLLGLEKRDKICCVKSLKVIFHGVGQGYEPFDPSITGAQWSSTEPLIARYFSHEFTVRAELEPAGKKKTINGWKVCCEPSRCILSQKVKGWELLDGVSQKATVGTYLNKNDYEQDGSLIEDNNEGKLIMSLWDEPGVSHLPFVEPTGSNFDRYLKFRAVVTDNTLDGTIVADKEGYWVRWRGVYPNLNSTYGGFDEEKPRDKN